MTEYLVIQSNELYRIGTRIQQTLMNLRQNFCLTDSCSCMGHVGSLFNTSADVSIAELYKCCVGASSRSLAPGIISCKGCVT